MNLTDTDITVERRAFMKLPMEERRRLMAEQAEKVSIFYNQDGEWQNLKGEKVASRFDIELDDGRIAHCWQALSQPYNDAEFSAGLVEGIEPDVVYLRVEKDGLEPWTIFLRRDEMQAIAWICSGALWALEMQDREKLKQ